ncbi:MAG: hypothetical protein IJU45_00195 [Clostridia bacterium]|nr:hypothetical protein [Clostridia bacterium]
MVSEFEVFGELENMTEIPEKDKDFCLDLCANCLEKTRRKVKLAADYSDPRVVSAAAAMALYVLVVRSSVSGTGEYSHFKAGDITISQSSTQKNGRIACAKEMYLEAQRELAPLVEDSGFYVGKIDI